MKSMCKIVLALSLLGGIFFSGDLSAGNPIRKFSRGISNVAFSILEVPVCVYDVNKEEGGIAALTYGVFKGIAMTVARIGVGVVDITTFYMPLPGCTDDPRDAGWGYGPMMRPEWVIDIDHNPYNLFYQNSPVPK